MLRSALVVLALGCVLPAAQAGPRRARLAEARNLHTATTLADGQIVVVGGLKDPPLATLGSMEIYDPVTGRWRPGQKLLHPRKGHTATLLADGRVLVVGGGRFDRRGRRWSSPPPELWDPASRTWREATVARGLPAEEHTATRMADGRVIVVGGMIADRGRGGTPPNPLIYDPQTDAWTTAGRLETPRLLHATVALDDGAVAAIGGISNDQVSTADPATGVRITRPTLKVLASIETWSPASPRWSTLASLAAPRAGHTATVLADGRVLVVGGSDQTRFLGSAEVCDLAAGECTAAGNLAIPRAGHVAVRLPSGDVAIIGGEGGSVTKPNQVAPIELWDPRTGQWRTGAKLARPRHQHTATVLSNGSVLIAGGAGCGKGCERSIDSFEIVRP